MGNLIADLRSQCHMSHMYVLFVIGYGKDGWIVWTYGVGFSYTCLLRLMMMHGRDSPMIQPHHPPLQISRPTRYMHRHLWTYTGLIESCHIHPISSRWMPTPLWSSRMWCLLRAIPYCWTIILSVVTLSRTQTWLRQTTHIGHRKLY